MNTQSILDLDPTYKPIIRRKLLPWWMKVFSWFFMICAAIIPIGLVAASVVDFNSQIALYGIQTTQPLSITGLILSALYLLKGAVGFGLWFEKDWAITAGLIDAALGIVACLFVMVVIPMTGWLGGQGSNFRLEIVLLALFLVRLLRIKRQW